MEKMKLNSEQVKFAFEILRKRSVFQSDIAKKFGMSRTATYHWCKVGISGPAATLFIEEFSPIEMVLIREINDAVEIEVDGRDVIINRGDHGLIKDLDWTLATSPDGATMVVSKYIGETDTAVIRMHRLIMNADEQMDVIHKDGDMLNNSRENLKLVGRW